jgi:hypothetical protein
VISSALLLHILVGQGSSTITRQLANFEGRFFKTETGYVCEWPGSAIGFATKSSKLVVRFNASSKNDRWQVEIDGNPTSVLALKPGSHEYTVQLSGLKLHQIRLVRRTEAFSGPTEFVGSSAESAGQKRSRHIEIIGDSISAGFGVDGKTKEEPYSFETANAYMTYGQIVARQLGSSCTTIAWSGKKMWPDNTIPEIYDYIIPSQKQHLWDSRSGSAPSAVLINLATNDFGKGVPDQAGWTTGYKTFVLKIRKQYPKTLIYLATGSMMSDNWPPKEKHLSTLKRYLDGIVSDLKDGRVKRIDFAVQQESDGIGSSWHPNAVTQAKMALVLKAALSKDLGWR